MAITEELLDELIRDYKKPEDLLGESGLLKQLTKRLLERAMQAEMSEHLGTAKNAFHYSLLFFTLQRRVRVTPSLPPPCWSAYHYEALSNVGKIAL